MHFTSVALNASALPALLFLLLLLLVNRLRSCVWRWPPTVQQPTAAAQQWHSCSGLWTSLRASGTGWLQSFSMPWQMLRQPQPLGTGQQQRLSVQRRRVLRQLLRWMLCGVLLSRAVLKLQLLMHAWLACRCVRVAATLLRLLLVLCHCRCCCVLVFVLVLCFTCSCMIKVYLHVIAA
jgi:hypothetical protein